jgi:hypothetical protein
VKSLSRKLGLLLASTVAVGSMTVALAPAASAEPSVTAARSTHVSASAPRWCKPAHWGRSWRWHDTRREGHWDHRVWSPRWQRWVWTHERRDNRYCARQRNQAPPRFSDGPRGNPGPRTGNPQNGENPGTAPGRS